MSERGVLLERIEAVVVDAGRALLSMQHAPMSVARKERLDVVTEADIAAERILVRGFRDLVPDAGVVSEEAGEIDAANERRWVIDPLDGTVNYASGLPWYSVSVAYQEHNRTILGLVYSPRLGTTARYIEGEIATFDDGPVRVSRIRSLADAVVSVVLTSHFSSDEVRRAAAIVARLGEAARGVRVIVSGALEMCYVAAGRLDAFVGIKADMVSHAPALALVRAAGGRVSTLRGTDASDCDVEKIASNGHIHEELLVQLSNALSD